jgi:hypothetical protein
VRRRERREKATKGTVLAFVAVLLLIFGSVTVRSAQQFP